MVPKLERRLRSPLVVAEQTAEPLVAIDPPARSDVVDASVDQSIAETLMVPLAVVVLDILAHNSPKMPLAKWNHVADTL